MTEMYLAAVQTAVARPNVWVELPRDFQTEFNARITGNCLESGYLRVQPQEGDNPITVSGKKFISTAAPVEARVTPHADSWRVSLRFPG